MSIKGVSIGIGVNLAETPMKEWLEPGAVWPVSLQSETGVRVDPETFPDRGRLRLALARHEDQFTTYGFAPIRELWLSRAAKLG